MQICTNSPSAYALTQAELCRHLSVERSSIKQIARRKQLVNVAGLYPWHQVWRAVHGIEGTLLFAHLCELRLRHKNSSILAGIEDLETALKTPLIDFAAMAGLLGVKPNTLSRRIADGRETLPFPTVNLGPRKRMFRPLEVLLWREEGMLLDLPKARDTDASPKDQNAKKEGGSGLEKAIFGAFSQKKEAFVD